MWGLTGSFTLNSSLVFQLPNPMGKCESHSTHHTFCISPLHTSMRASPSMQSMRLPPGWASFLLCACFSLPPSPSLSLTAPPTLPSPQVPIGMVSDTEEMRRMQLWALALFTVLNVVIFVSLLLVGLILTGIGRILLVTIGGGGWLALLLFNMRMASRPRRVIQSFLQTKAKTKLGRRLGKGQVVVVKGAVSLLHEELLSTEFHNVPVRKSQVH